MTTTPPPPANFFGPLLGLGTKKNALKDVVGAALTKGREIEISLELDALSSHLGLGKNDAY